MYNIYIYMYTLIYSYIEIYIYIYIHNIIQQRMKLMSSDDHSSPFLKYGHWYVDPIDDMVQPGVDQTP